MTFLDRPRFRAVFLVFTLFTVFAADAWRYSISWYGFGVLAVLMTAVSVLLLVRVYARGAWTWGELPIPLVGFLALATASIAWSFYPGASALGILLTWMTAIVGLAVATSYSLDQILRGLGTTMRLILGLSLLFELVVSVFVRAPLLPFFSLADIGSYDKIPKLLFWSRDLLFEGGKIQGIVGNSSLLAFVALVGLIVFCIQLAARRVHPVAGAFWILVAVGVILLTRSATITVALVVLAIAVLAVLAIRRSRTRGTVAVYITLVGLLGAAIAAAFVFSAPLLAVLGKSSDLTGRIDIWKAVIALAQERPAFGWGWVSFWAPWAPPFDTLAFEGGVRQLHAHNAWLDVWLQLGIVGLVVFGALVLTTLVRAWQLAVDRPQVEPGATQPFSAVSLLPLLLIVALLAQSIAESRLLIEYGLVVLVVVAVKTKLGYQVGRG